MTWTSRVAHAGWVLVAVLASTTSSSFQKTVDKNSVLDSPVDENTAIRFYYNPAGNYFHVPLIFRPVSPGDPRLDTATIGTEGHTTYISLQEMQQLTQGLGHSDLSWQESEKVEPLGPFKQLPPWADRMEILEVRSRGMAKTSLDPKTICETLQPLDSALKSPRALWEFRGFRVNYGCRVSRFNADAYPDH
jgi:hypothetical protein